MLCLLALCHDNVGGQHRVLDVFTLLELHLAEHGRCFEGDPLQRVRFADGIVGNALATQLRERLDLDGHHVNALDTLSVEALGDEFLAEVLEFDLLLHFSDLGLSVLQQLVPHLQVHHELVLVELLQVRRLLVPVEHRQEPGPELLQLPSQTVDGAHSRCEDGAGHGLGLLAGHEAVKNDVGGRRLELTGEVTDQCNGRLFDVDQAGGVHVEWPLRL
mmetsp:Transcript_18828/g.44124  ORF Transcript_18828/g.44124 Transcript_18828/m.44124 type:complete len:217 (+) Transcript_18828:2440-3090(+)